VIQLKCGNTKFLECMNFMSAVFTLLHSLAITAVSYINIITAVVKIPSVAGRQKAFSTCASHLAVVSKTVTLKGLRESDKQQKESPPVES